MQNQYPGDSSPGWKWIRRYLAFHGFDPCLSPAPYLLNHVPAKLRVTECMQGSGRLRRVERKHLWSSDQKWPGRIVVNDVANEQLAVLAIDIRDESAHFGGPKCHTKVSN